MKKSITCFVILTFLIAIVPYVEAGRLQGGYPNEGAWERQSEEYEKAFIIIGGLAATVLAIFVIGKVLQKNPDSERQKAAQKKDKQLLTEMEYIADLVSPKPPIELADAGVVVFKW